MTDPRPTTTDPVTDRPVCVTGASGFIASHIVRQLLDAGYRVRGTVRDASPDTVAEKYGFLTELPGASGQMGRLDLVSADLMEPDSFVAAVAGCEHVLHTASPYEMDVDDPMNDLVLPAVRGTRGVLEACAASDSVTRVVLTSSVAAITDEPEPGHVLTEDDWNDRSSVDRNPYYFSKVQAERTAWKFMDDRPREFDLVVINPFLVLGPSLTPSLNTSNQILVDLVHGVYPGILSLTFGAVDVRDVARAHILAMETPDASGRYLTAAELLPMRELVDLMTRLGYDEGTKLPHRSMDSPLGDLIVRLASHFQPKGTGTYIRTHLGRIPEFDNSKIRHDLGLRFRPMDVTVAETLADLVRWGHLEPPQAPEPDH